MFLAMFGFELGGVAGRHYLVVAARDGSDGGFRVNRVVALVRADVAEHSRYAVPSGRRPRDYCRQAAREARF